jgi:hypothetical protein
MIRIYTVFFSLLFAVTLATSCKNADAGNHLPAKQMEKILLDISLAESYSTMVKDSTHAFGTKNYDSLTVYYKEVFEHHKVTSAQFSESLAWYKSHPTELDSIYADLLPKVIRIQSKAGSKL